MPAALQHRSVRSVIVFTAFLAIVMAFGVEAMLPAFDEIDDEFGFTSRGLSTSLLVTSLLVGMGVGTLVWGPVSDRFGRRPVLVAGLVLYAIAATASAFAPSITALLAARALWGFGAAAPGGLRYAIARDLFEGDRMARVVTISTAVFLIGPLLMPIVGQMILELGPWQAIALAAVALAAAAALWSVRFGETLPPESRRPLRVRELVDAFRTVVHARRSVGAIVAATFFFAAFFTWLGSAQPIIDRIFDRDDQFIWWFGLVGLGMSGALVVTDRLIGHIGTRLVALRSAVLFVAVGVAGVAMTITMGSLSFAPWFIWVMAINALCAVMSSVCSALALDPVGEIAGFTSSLLNFAALGPGALLAAIVDAQIDDSVTPMVIGVTVFGALGAVALWVSQPSSAGSSAVRRETKSRSSSSIASSSGGGS